nr:MAG TPA: NAD-dependent protein deacetylase sirtuin-1 [Caudoviricetes sp.]
MSWPNDHIFPGAEEHIRKQKQDRCTELTIEDIEANRRYRAFSRKITIRSYYITIATFIVSVISLVLSICK